MSTTHGHKNPEQAPLPIEIIGFATGAFETNCYVVIATASTEQADDSGRRPATVIDPGHGAHEAILGVQDEHNFYVKDVVLTHGHMDHVRDAGHFGVPVHIHPHDRVLLENPKMGSSVMDMERIFDVANMPIPEDIQDLGDEIMIAGQRFSVHHMPGHSPGSVMFRVPGVVLGGDVLFNGGVGRTDLPGSSPEDMALSLKRLVHDCAADDVVLPGHGPQTTVGQERRNNPFLHDVG